MSFNAEARIVVNESISSRFVSIAFELLIISLSFVTIALLCSFKSSRIARIAQLLFTIALLFSITFSSIFTIALLSL